MSGSGAVTFTYSPVDDSYTVTLPGYDPGKLVTTGANGSFDETGWIKVTQTINDVTAGNSSAVQPVLVILDWPASFELQYTSFGQWADRDFSSEGYFVYGSPTPAGGVPVTGSASFDGTIRGLTTDEIDVFGSIDFLFNFGAGTLSGEMKPTIAPVWDAIPLGTYTFRDTVFSSGSTSFSGAFSVTGSNAASAFSGQFTGPNATELMGSWRAPYLNPLSNSWGTMVGVFAGKRGP